MISFFLDWTNVESPRRSSYSPKVIEVNKKISNKNACVFDNKVIPWRLIREGISVNALVYWKANLPDFFVDEHGNTRRTKDDKLIFMAPNWSDSKEQNRQAPF